MRSKKHSRQKKLTKHVFKLLRFIGNVALWSIFLFWGFESMEKFMSSPTSSSVSFINGDDNNGNFAMPAVTICLRSHRDWMKFKTRQVEKCVDLGTAGADAFNHKNDFSVNLKDCLVSNIYSEISSNESSSTTEYSIFDNLFGTEKPIIENFVTLKEYVDVIHLHIQDILYSFSFANFDLYNMPSTDREHFLQTFWIPTFHEKHGQCFTFDPMKNHFNLTSDPKMSIEFRFDLYQNCSTFSKLFSPEYLVTVHDSFEDRFGAFICNPKVLVTKNKLYEMKLSKTLMENMNKEDRKCFEELFYGFEKCVHLKATQEFIKQYNCTLPWMMNQYEFVNYTYCESNSENTLDLVDMINVALEFNNIAENECPNYLPCKRSIYEDLLMLKPNIETEESSRSSLSISFSSPYIQVIKDSWSYNFQSFIGEVGGTLGLLLGFSFSSLFDLFEYFIDKL